MKAIPNQKHLATGSDKTICKGTTDLTPGCTQTYSEVIGLPGYNWVHSKETKKEEKEKEKKKDRRIWIASMWKTPAYQPVVVEIGGISMHVVENGQCEEVTGLQS
jgi:hypothetical protein